MARQWTKIAHKSNLENTHNIAEKQRHLSSTGYFNMWWDELNCLAYGPYIRLQAKYRCICGGIIFIRGLHHANKEFLFYLFSCSLHIFLVHAAAVVADLFHLTPVHWIPVDRARSEFALNNTESTISNFNRVTVDTLNPIATAMHKCNNTDRLNSKTYTRANKQTTEWNKLTNPRWIESWIERELH